MKVSSSAYLNKNGPLGIKGASEDKDIIIKSSFQVWRCGFESS